MKNMEKYLTLLVGDVDGLLLTSRYSRFYSAEFDIAEGVAVVSKAGCRYFTDSRYIESAQNSIQGYDVRMTYLENPYTKLINEAIADFGITKLGYEEDFLSVAEFLLYEKELNAALTPMSGPINAFRGTKEDWELDRMRKAQAMTDKAFTQVLTKIRPGMTEKQLQAELIYCILTSGADGLAFDPIVVSGPKTSMPHGVAGDRVIREGDFVTMDFGAAYGSYCSDMTRTVAVGYATEEMKEVYETVLRAQEAAIAATRAGISGSAIDKVARDIIRQAGYGEYFGHGYGHSLGLQIHEDPNCRPEATTILQPGVVCSAEPGIYLPGKFGVRIEDVVILTADGCEDITHSPKNLIIV